MGTWQQQSDEIADEPLNAENAEPADAHDGVYVGVVTTRVDGRLITIKLKVIAPDGELRREDDHLVYVAEGAGRKRVGHYLYGGTR